MQRFQLGPGHHRVGLPVLSGHRGKCFLSGGRLRSWFEPNVFSVHRDVESGHPVGHQHKCLLSDQPVFFILFFPSTQFKPVRGSVLLQNQPFFFSLNVLKMHCWITSLDWNIIRFLDDPKSCYSITMKVK